MLLMIFRSIKEGFRGFARHFGMSASSILIVSITLIILSAFIIFSAHLERFTRHFESTMEISVQIDYDYESEKQEEEIRKQIEAIEGVKNITYYTKEEEMAFFMSTIEDEREKEIYEPFEADMNPMHDSFYVETDTGAQLETVANTIKKIEGIYSVEYGGENTMNAVSVMMNVRRITLIVVIVMLIMAIFLIRTTIRQTISSRVDEMRIMQDVGASNSFIRAPFVWEGIIIGAIGAIVPVALTIYAYVSYYRSMGGKLLAGLFTLITPNPFLIYVCLIIVFIGMLVGFVGSWTSVTGFLRARR